MSLEVSIEKKLDGFTLRAAFTAGNTSTALLGASGCGKSMTLRCIAGIVKPDRGRIVLDGRVRMPCCRQGILAGAVLAFARALGEYGATSMIAGYTPGKTATIATTVYQLWRTNDEAGAMRWVLVDIAISVVVLLAVNLLEKKQKAGGRK